MRIFYSHLQLTSTDRSASRKSCKRSREPRHIASISTSGQKGGYGKTNLSTALCERSRMCEGKLTTSWGTRCGPVLWRILLSTVGCGESKHGRGRPCPQITC